MACSCRSATSTFTPTVATRRKAATEVHDVTTSVHRNTMPSQSTVKLAFGALNAIRGSPMRWAFVVEEAMEHEQKLEWALN